VVSGVLFIVWILLSLLVLQLDANDSLRRPELQVVAILAIVTVAVLPTVWTVGARLLVRLSDVPPWRCLLIIHSLVLLSPFLAFLASRFVRGNELIIYKSEYFVALNYFLAITASAPAFAAMWECYTKAARLEPNNESITEQIKLRNCLFTALAVLGYLVVLGFFVTTAFMVSSQTNPNIPKPAPFPATYVFTWGFLSSSILLVSFLPAFNRLKKIANNTIDNLLPLMTPDKYDWQIRLKERKDLAEILKITGDDNKALLASAILIAASLIGGVFALFLKSNQCQ